MGCLTSLLFGKMKKEERLSKLPLFIYLCLLNLQIGYSISINGNRNTVLITAEENQAPVLGLTTGFGFIAVATKSRIFFYTDDENRRTAGSISLPFVQRDKFNELKVLSPSEVFYCDEVNCGLCTYSGTQSSCSSLELSTTEYDLKQITSAAVVKMNNTEQLMLRISLIDTGNSMRAIIMKFKAQDNGIISPTVTASDAPFMTDHETVLGFERKGYIYFVGSAKQPYEPAANLHSVNFFNVSATKITRVCGQDQTTDLASKMTFFLGCADEAEDKSSRSEAAFYDENKGLITVAIGSVNNQDHRICSFKLTDIEKRFNMDWEVCQQTSISDSQSCEYSKDLEDMIKKPYCLIFSHMAQGYTTTVCSKYNGGGQKGEVYNNCELHKSEGRSYKYGWLEDYYILRGELLVKIPASKNINQITSLYMDGNSFYATVTIGREPKIIRGTASENTEVRIVWTSNTSNEDHFGIAKYSTLIPVRVMYPSGPEVRTATTSCRDLYRTCDDLNRGGWQDPLNCAWCTTINSFRTISEGERSACPSYLTNVCPPNVKQIMKFSNQTGFTAYGSSFKNIKDPAILACNVKCEIVEMDDNTLHCQIPNGGEVDRSCETFSVVGKLGDHSNYKLDYKYSSDHDTQTDTREYSAEAKKNGSPSWKAALAVLSVFFLIVIVALIVYFMRKRIPQMKTHIRQTQMIPRIGNEYALEHMRGGEDLPGRRGPALSGDMYVGIFRDFPKELKIDYNYLKIDRQLGEGHYGVVYSARYDHPDGNSMQVACKQIKEGRISEFYEEARVMAQFDHANVLKLVGIALDGAHMPIAITEFMANGDLTMYIKDERNHITLRDLLRFAREIAEGMDHIHSKGYIHRDLAARNCMLDDNLRVQIADFGLCRQLDAGTQLYQPIDQNRNLPVRWMPPEILENGFGYPSDIWSYGILLWELTTRGNLPYGNRVSGRELPELLKGGYRLSQPPYCPDVLYNDVMMACWDPDPDQRPTFQNLIRIIDHVVHILHESNYSHLNTGYERVSNRSPMLTHVLAYQNIRPDEYNSLLYLNNLPRSSNPPIASSGNNIRPYSESEQYFSLNSDLSEIRENQSDVKLTENPVYDLLY